jgi:putative cell wall-binding protein
VALGNNGSDTGGCTNDVVNITFTNNATGTPGDTFPITISGISYTVGSAAATGLVALSFTSNVSSANFGAATPNALIAIKGSASATANNPAVVITQGTAGSPSSIVVTETAAGAVATSICIAPSGAGAPFTFATAGSATASAGSGAGTIGAPALSGNAILATVTKSTSLATTYTFTGFTVNDLATTGPASVTIMSGGASCATETTSISANLTVFGSAPSVLSAIAGADTDGTAIAELEAAYPIQGGCVTGGNVILATDQNFPDALAASFLAGNLGTGILLTPTNNLSSETQQAIQAEGVTNVYVVGGPIAVSQNVITQVQALPAYTCGGVNKTGQNVKVTGPIFGPTQYDTAQQIATTNGLTVGTANLSGAYNGQYNDTTGGGSATPSGAGLLRTAIVTSGANFPDATAGSIIAFRNKFPVVLTDPNTLSPQAATTLSALGIQQVIVLGGPLAVSDVVVGSIKGMSISVIRVAGQDQTDTAQQLANFELSPTANFSGLGWGATSGMTSWGRMILLARGDFYADALAGSVLGKLGANPILLTETPATLGQYLTNFLNTGGSPSGINGLNSVANFSGNIQTIQPLGGPLALQFSTLNAAAAAVAAG